MRSGFATLPHEAHPLWGVLFSEGFLGAFMMKENLEKELIDSSKMSEKVIIWSFSLESFHFVEYSIKTIRRDRDELLFDPVGFVSLDALKNIITGLGKINIFLTEKKIFLRVNFKSINEKNSITTSLPEFSMKEERRQGPRLPVTRVEVNLIRGGKEEKGVLRDISEGGASIYITERKAKVPQVEDNVDNLYLKSDQVKKIGPGKIVAVKKIPPYQEKYPYAVWKISLSFDTELDLAKYLKEL